MNSPDLTVAMVKMVLSLALVLLILWAAHRWLRRSVPAGRMNAKGRLIKVLGSQPLGMKKSIALVQVPGAILVVGVGTEQVNLLKSIDDPEMVENINPAEENKSGLSFRDHLQRIAQNFTGSGDSSASEERRDRVS